jgi:hypothetical protein
MDDFVDLVKVLVGSLLGIAGVIFVFCLPWLIFGDTRVAEIKNVAQATWEKNGFQVVGYEGYELTLFGRPGGCVWYVVKRNETAYHGCISRWGDEYHIYSLRALNAIKGD